MKSFTQRRWHGLSTCKDMLENALSDTVNWLTKSGGVAESFKSLLG